MPEIDLTNRIMLAGFSAGEQRMLKRMLHRMRRNLAPACVKPAGAGKPDVGTQPPRA
jgi:hypothetical protein